MKIQFVWKPRTSWRWVLIFFLSMWAGYELGTTLKADATQPAPKQWLDTRDLVEARGNQQDRVREMLYGSQTEEAQPKKHGGTSVPNEEQAPHPDQIQGRERREGKHPFAEGRAPRSLALPVPAEDPRRGHWPADPGTQVQETLHQKAGPLSGGG